MNSFGNNFRISLWGASHTKYLGVVIDSVPPGIELNENMFAEDLDRRKAGAKGTTKRHEKDLPEILSGTLNGKTTGGPLHISFKNSDYNSKEYEKRSYPRPGHADFAAEKKYNGFQDSRGGGFFSGRMTVLLVAAGIVAKKILPDISFDAKIKSVGGKTEFENILDKAEQEGDTLGAEVECCINGLSAGYGEPFFYSLESVISSLVFAVPGAKAIAFGSGFDADKYKGSEFNDLIEDSSGKTKTNHSGGINGGISNGNPVVFSVKFKPTSSIKKAQETWNPETNRKEALKIKGRHDLCYAIRTPVILESVAAIALADLKLMKN